MTDHKFILSQHAKEQIIRRQISEEQMWHVAHAPEQIVEEKNKQKIYQSIVGRHLLRIFINFEKQPPLIKTIYRTSKADKYWQHES